MSLQKTVSKILNKEVSLEDAKNFANEQYGLLITYYREQIKEHRVYVLEVDDCEFKFYDITTSDHPVIIKTFFYDSDSLFVQFFTLSGKIETEGILNGRKRVGNWKYFYPNGELMSEENYENGKLHGEQLIYYPDGQVTEFAVYKFLFYQVHETFLTQIAIQHAQFEYFCTH